MSQLSCAESAEKEQRSTTLEQWVRNKQLTVPQAVQLLRALADTAALTHAKGVAAGLPRPERIQLRVPSAESQRWIVEWDLAPPP